MSPDERRPVTRRTFIRAATTAGLTAGALAAAPRLLTPPARAAAASTPRAGLNILVVMVDQLRTPWVYMSPRLARRTMPSVARLGDEGVRFSNYFTSSNDCTPSRTTQATGLYTHQTAIFATTPPTDLNVGFPTWGTMLRQKGYDTYWFGKWHLSGGQSGACADPYEAYGFTADWPGSGTCPSPNGGPGQGQAMDPVIRQQFRDWLAARPAGGDPWAATVSFVNPHDIAWYPRWTRVVEGQSRPPAVTTRLPANFETTLGRRARNKPEMQRRAQQIENESFGFMPSDRENPRLWTKQLDTYLLMQSQVDVQISLVLKALKNSPFADTTIVVFVSDHGEYAGAHGMRGKGFAFYDEGSRVPLIVKDPTGGWTRRTHIDRPQLVESVDLAALLLTLGTGGDDWRGDATYAQIAGRADIAGILANPAARGRPYIAHATDEPGTSATLPTAQQIRPAPNHITAVRTHRGKYVRYAYWVDGTTRIDESRPVQFEAYDYRDRLGRLEVDNIHDKRGSGAGARALVRRLDALLDRAMTDEIQAPLPAPLQPVQAQAFTDWFAQPPATFTRDTDN